MRLWPRRCAEATALQKALEQDAAEHRLAVARILDQARRDRADRTEGQP